MWNANGARSPLPAMYHQEHVRDLGGHAVMSSLKSTNVKMKDDGRAISHKRGSICVGQ